MYDGFFVTLWIKTTIINIMTATLIVLLIITLLAILILPFSRALMKDRAELHENPLDKKFNILISRINQLMMNGCGEVVKFKDDPRMLNLFDENHANMLIHFNYSTGSITITLKYKYFHVELVKKMQFDNMRQAETFRQQDVANHFVEEARIAIRKHQEKVGQERGLKNASGDFLFSDLTSDGGSSDNPVDIVRGMYDKLTKEQKLAIVNVARVMFTADGSSVNDFKNHPLFSDLLLNFQVNFSEAESEFGKYGEGGIINELTKAHNENKSLIMMVMPLLPFTGDQFGPNEQRIEKFYGLFGKAGYPQSEIDNEIEKMMALSQMFGMK